MVRVTFPVTSRGSMWALTETVFGRLLKGWDGALMKGERVIQRKASIDDLENPEELLQLAFRASPNVTAISDAKTARFVEVSDGFCKASGYERDEVIGKSTLELGLFADPQQVQRVRRQCWQPGRPVMSR